MADAQSRLQALSDDLSARKQVEVGDLAALREAGFRSILCARPDGEAADQPSFATIAAEASRLGLEARHVPIIPNAMGAADVAAFAAAYAELPKPILGYCASGRRIEAAAAAARIT